MGQSARAVLFAIVFVLAGGAAANTSECARPRPLLAGRPAQARILRPPEFAKEPAPALGSPWRETQLHPRCVSLACPDSIVLGVGF